MASFLVNPGMREKHWEKDLVISFSYLTAFLTEFGKQNKILNYSFVSIICQLPIFWKSLAVLMKMENWLF